MTPHPQPWLDGDAVPPEPPAEVAKPIRIPQREALLSKFRIFGGVLRTRDFRNDPAFACEYRRLICELVAHGYVIYRIKETQTEWRYELHEGDGKGQLNLAV